MIGFFFSTLHAAQNTEQNAQEGIISFYHENYQEAERFLSEAANDGNTEAQYYLGIMHFHGYGVPVNYKESVRLFTLGANKNHSGSQIALGVLYIQGIGLPQNFKQAAVLFTLAAKQDNLDAQNILGWIYKYGIGVSQSRIIAYALWNNVAATGNMWARVNRNYILQEMTEDELYKAQELSMDLSKLWSALNRVKKEGKNIKTKRIG